MSSDHASLASLFPIFTLRPMTLLAQELLITELILDGVLNDRDAAEIAAMLSATTCQWRQGDGAKFQDGSLMQKVR